MLRGASRRRHLSIELIEFTSLFTRLQLRVASLQALSDVIGPFAMGSADVEGHWSSRHPFLFSEARLLHSVQFVLVS